MMRLVAFVTAAALAALLAAAAHAQNDPVKPVRIIVPVAPGGGTDPQARLLGRKFQESMGQNVVVENRTGAASMIGTELVVKSPPDGYTLLAAASSLAGAYTLRKDLSFDMLKDLAPVGQISSAATFLVVHASVPASTVKEFIALAVTTAKPSPLMPNVPPLASLYPGFEATNWYGIFAPAGTPAAIVEKLSREIASAIKLPDVREFMAREGADPVGSTPREFTAFFKSEVDRYARVIRSANIRSE